MTKKLPRNALIALLFVSVTLGVLSPLSAQEAAAVRPSIAPSKFWNGKEGAACMVDVLRARAPRLDARTNTFQDFDVIFPIVEIASGDGSVRLSVLSAPELMLRSASYPFMGFEAVVSGQHRYYLDQVGNGAVPASVLGDVLAALGDWEQICGVFQSPLHRVGVCSCNLRPEDFAPTGQFDFEALRPFLKPAPLTPVEIH